MHKVIKSFTHYYAYTFDPQTGGWKIYGKFENVKMMQKALSILPEEQLLRMRYDVRQLSNPHNHKLTTYYLNRQDAVNYILGRINRSQVEKADCRTMAY